MNKLARVGCFAGAALAALWFPMLAVAADESSSLDSARALYEKNCVVCHPLERSLAKTMDREGWTATMQKMIANGAKLDQQQADLIREYLTARSLFETKCNSCHELARPLAAIKNPQEWRATVAKMSGKKAGFLAEDEATAISNYLALVNHAQ